MTGAVQKKVFLVSAKTQRLVVTNQKSFGKLKFSSISSPLSRNYCDESKDKKEVLFDSINGKGLITFNRPEVLNVCSVSVGKQILDKLGEFQSSKSMVIVRGQGDRAFCAGGDVRMLRSLVMSGTGVSVPAFQVYRICSMIQNLKIPYIALMNGIAMGGGLAMGVLGRYRVASENTLCAMPETSIGVYPDAGAAYFLPRLRVKSQAGKLGGKFLGLFLALTGHRLKGSDNFHCGIATHMCSNSMLNDLQAELLSMDNSQEAIPGEIEKILQHYTDACPDSKNPFSLAENWTKIDQLFSAHCVEGIIENLKADDSDWAHRVVEGLEKMSPTSLKITFKYFEIAQNFDLQNCLRLDYRLFQRAVQGPDFMEGVRALLIDKDQKPRWNPSKLENVEGSYVDSFFEPFPNGEDTIHFEDC